MSRVDLAVDFEMQTAAEADTLAHWLDRHIILKWRSRKGRKRYWEGNGLWVLWAGGHRGRDLCVYGKKENTVRLELRFQKPAAVRRAGLDKLEELENLDVKELLAHNVKAEKFSARHIINVMRRTHKHEMIRHQTSKRPSDHRVTDEYQARIPARVKRIVEHADMQTVRAEKGTEKVSMDWLNIPVRLTIPEQGRQREKGKGGWH